MGNFRFGRVPVPISVLISIAIFFASVPKILAQDVEKLSPRGQLILAVKKGDQEGVEAALGAGATLDMRDDENRTMLMLAVVENQGKMVTYLAKEKKVNLELKLPGDLTALHLALDNGLYKIAEELLKAGAKVDALDKFKRSALTRAIRKKDLKAIDTLMPFHSSVKIRDQLGYLPLRYARETFKEGLEKIITWKNTKGQTRLIETVIENDLASAKILVEYGADIEAQDALGMSAMMHASRVSPPSAQYLILRGARTVIRDKENIWVAPTLALASNHPQLAKDLISSRDLQKNPIVVQAVKLRSEAALHEVLRAIQSVALSADEITEILDSEGDDGSALTIALNNGQKDLANQLFEEGATISYRTLSALQMKLSPKVLLEWTRANPKFAQVLFKQSIVFDNEAIFSMLLKNGFNLNVQQLSTVVNAGMRICLLDIDEEGYSSFLRAVAANDIELVKKFLEILDDIYRYRRGMVKLQIGLAVVLASKSGFAPMVAVLQATKTKYIAEKELYFQALLQDVPEHIRLLSKLGVDKEVVNQSNDTPLLAALKASNSGLMELVDESRGKPSNIEAVDSDGNSAFMLGARSQRLEFLEYALPKRPKLTIVNKSEENALMISIENKIPRPFIQKLIPFFKESKLLNAQKLGGDTALILAAKRGEFGIVQDLVSAEADVTIRNDYGRTAKTSTATKEIVDFLLPLQDASDFRLLEAALEEGEAEVGRNINASVNIDAKNAEGKTHMDLAVAAKDKARIELLKKFSAQKGWMLASALSGTELINSDYKGALADFIAKNISSLEFMIELKGTDGKIYRQFLKNTKEMVDDGGVKHYFAACRLMWANSYEGEDWGLDVNLSRGFKTDHKEPTGYDVNKQWVFGVKSNCHNTMMAEDGTSYVAHSYSSYDWGWGGGSTWRCGGLRISPQSIESNGCHIRHGFEYFPINGVKQNDYGAKIITNLILIWIR